MLKNIKVERKLNINMFGNRNISRRNEATKRKKNSLNYNAF